MATTPYTLDTIPTPAYVLEEDLLRKNLQVIRQVAEQAGVEIILAFKAYALWKTFPIFREYISGCTASSPWEAQMGHEQMQCLTHTYAPIYRDEDLETILRCSGHLTFNSLEQFERFYPQVAAYEEHRVSCGLRINPEYSEVETDLYNPASPTSRLGIPVADLPAQLPAGVEGLHFHTHCESNSYALERTLKVVEQKFAPQLEQIQWINMGGGHLMTEKDYDTDHLIQLLRAFKDRHPHLRVILEPGSAFAWQTGTLVTTIEDIVERGGVRTLMMDASFTSHMPDTLEMPYQPRIRGAANSTDDRHTLAYRVGGNSCLSGDYKGDWYFASAPRVGDRLIFEDMIHYTTVKTTMFNGIVHPSIWLHKSDGSWEEYRRYSYEDYLHRMD